MANRYWPSGAPKVLKTSSGVSSGILPTSNSSFTCVLSTARRRRPSLHQLAAGDLLQVAVHDRLVLGLGEIEAVENLQRLADVGGALLGVERAVRGEHQLLGRIEGEAALGRRLAAEHRGVAVEAL